MLVVGIAATALRCADKDVSQIIGTNRPDPVVDASSPAPRCVPGQTLACMGACGGQLSVGYQLCADDGRSYGECICPTGDRPFISIGPDAVLLRPEGIPGIGPLRPVPTDGMTPATERGIVGARCEDNADCQGSLGCLTASSTLLAGGGVAGGYCTVDCASNDFCRSIDPLSACGNLGGQDMCIKLCLSKTPEEGEPKCLSRPDLTCISLAALRQEEPSPERQLGICAPQCQSDATCGGRRCDLSQGICIDSPRPGTPVGSTCEEAEACAGGVCLGLTEQAASFCSAFCTLGAAGCGFESGETPGAACLFSQVQGEGSGDRGLCAAVCATQADCSEPGAECLPFEASPRGGICLRPAGPITEPPDDEEPDAGPPEDNPPDEEPDAGIGEPEPDPVPTTGLACADDADCGSGTCLTSDSDPFGSIEGGPAGGYCSAGCAGNDDCEPGALCLPLPGGGRCFLRCSADEETPCHGRDTLACNLSSGANNGFCQPSCNSDAECGERTCAPFPDGLCIDAVPCAGDIDCETGACDEDRQTCLAPEPCTLDADCGEERICNGETATCARAPAVAAGGVCAVDADCPGQVCLPTAAAGFCSAECALGTPIGCELYGTNSFCLLRAAPPPSTAGLCVGLCNVPADCATPGFRCVSINGNVNGNTGACLP